MATIQKRGKSYLISTSCGYDNAGKQLRKTMTWKPEPNMTARQEKKAVNAAAVRFEDQVQSGQYIDPSITLSQFIEKWIVDYAEQQLQPDTVESYLEMLPVITSALGHIRLCKLQPHHLIDFYKNLSEAGMRRDTKYKPLFDFTKILKTRGILKKDASQALKISDATLRQICHKQNVSKKTAEAVCNIFELNFKKDFKPVGKEKLSGTTLLRYHNLLKSILTTAVHWQVIPSSPADRIEAPRAEHIEQECLSAAQAQQLVLMLNGEPENRKAATLIALCSGMRRSELYALTWDDIDINCCFGIFARSATTPYFIPF